MQEAFNSYIINNKLCHKENSILAAVSGGIDSTAMLHLLLDAGYTCGIAHCNFGLRDEEADRDEQFVQKIAEQHNIPFYTTRFNTKQYAEENNMSIQMAARDLRYEWFEHIRQEHDYDLIAVAHNSDDVVESVLNNLSRGTGLRGLSGIKPRVNKIIRPLLFASREDIIQYCHEHDIQHVEDSSNATIKYSRNLLRHKIIPLFEQINPRFRETIIENTGRLNDNLLIYEQAINKTRHELLKHDNGTWTISIEKLQELAPLKTWLFELFRDFNITQKHVNDLAGLLNNIPGKQILTPTHRIVKDRQFIMATYRFKEDKQQYYIDEGVTMIEKPIHLSFKKLMAADINSFPDDPAIAYLDYDKLVFPLLLRKWQHGDYFMPLGMTGIKKLSDFFIDQKLSVIAKEKAWLLVSGGKIAWIAGHRIDERYKITKETDNVLEVRWKT